MNALRTFYYQLSPSLRFAVRRLYYWPMDFYEGFSGERPSDVPPKGMIFTGQGDFVEQGDKMLRLFQDLGSLQPQHQVLDVGCGIGRIARPLVSFLNQQEGSYHGFDAVNMGIKWCTTHLATQHPHFNFRYIPLKNDLYRRDGKDPANFVFPYKDRFFDFVCVISVFTHMLPDSVLNYLEQIFMKLKPGGICFTTFFIVPKGGNQTNGKGAFNFPYDFGHYVLMDQKVKSANVGYKAHYLLPKIKQIGFEVVQQYPGSWSSNIPSSQCLDFQDIVVLKKPVL